MICIAGICVCGWIIPGCSTYRVEYPWVQFGVTLNGRSVVSHCKLAFCIVSGYDARALAPVVASGAAGC